MARQSADCVKGWRQPQNRKYIMEATDDRALSLSHTHTEWGDWVVANLHWLVRTVIKRSGAADMDGAMVGALLGR